ncbi:hypothetical protein M422DRAFT_244825 [Sphaerobolus stellatus SS14]|nr:hypothetical protein M422DRAFT_244825 [Sphaerobolus stellatus SS14]
MISELEELVAYKKLADQPDRQKRLRDTWNKRLLGCQQDINIWQRILKVRSLAVKPSDDIETTVRFANMCRKAGRLTLALRAMETLVQSEAEGRSKAPPEIVYAQVKLIWANGEHVKALMSLRRFIHELCQNPGSNDQVDNQTKTRILAKSYLRHGDWQMTLDGGLNAHNAASILGSYHLATKHDPQRSKAWHTWALANLDMIRNPSGLPTVDGDVEPVTNRTSHVVAAIQGFFRSLDLMSQNNLPDTLSLLTIWFKYGAQGEVTTAMNDGFKLVSCDTWLDVVPQIIARIQTPTPLVRQTLTRLLADIGYNHPQALVYPLTVAAKSPSLPRKMAALKILDQICTHSRNLVEQANLVGQELSRVAISWVELWREGLAKSGRHYLNGSAKDMLASLRPFYDLFERPTTPAEMEFRNVYGSHLENARILCEQNILEGDKKYFDQAWNIYLKVYYQLDKTKPEVRLPTRPSKGSKFFDLHSVAPALVEAVNLDLAVPGTYTSGSPVVRILKFKPLVMYLNTKQMPRQVTIYGDNGQRFLYLLKGNEDLRQDERVMQVMGLMNTLLTRDRECLNRRLHLQRYSVIPLAPDVGLIGWMADMDPLQNIIMEYRNSHKILPDLEHRIILQDEPEYDGPISLERKLEVFEFAMNQTTGQDLYRILWLKSVNSEDWVNRRTTYTRSLAVGSMMCYLLGVGDRHPGNIMLDRKSGKVVHIDFGDCFEVSFERDQYPEAVPFRLTRMLRHAMEVCGIEGGFKISCERSMAVLRDNKESLLAVLEALVYDPLINWRLVRADSQVTSEGPSSLGTTEGPNRRTLLNEDEILEDVRANGGRNERALAVYSRVEDKLTGRDFGSDQLLSVSIQVEKLILEATSNQNLCQLFHGWCPFW